MREKLENRLELRVLGRFEARAGGAPLELAPMPERLLAVLTLRAGETLSAEALIESIWGGGATGIRGERPTGVCHAASARVSRPGGSSRSRAGYRLVVAEGELDAERFEHLLADGRQALATRTIASPSRSSRARSISGGARRSAG